MSTHLRALSTPRSARKSGTWLDPSHEHVSPWRLITFKGSFLLCCQPKRAGIAWDDEYAGTSLDAARAVKGKLMSTSTIFDDMVVAGYDPKSIPAWVARPGGVKAPVARPSQSTGPAPAAGSAAVAAGPVAVVAGSVAVAAGSVAVAADPADAVDRAPIEEDANPRRPLPEQPPQPQRQPTTADQRLQPWSTGSTTSEQPQPPQPPEGAEILYVDGKPAVELKDARGKPTELRWAAEDDLNPPQAPADQVGANISKATLQEVEVRTQATMSKVALNPSNVMAHAFLSTTKDPDTERPYFEGDFGGFVNWAINYAVLDAYGLRAAVITTGRGKYQKI